jgi:uncharacterized Zn finger protein
MTGRENAEAKALRYLTDGRLEVQRVTETAVDAACLGDEGDLYRLSWNAERRRWECSCPAYGRRCAHVLVLGRVVRKPAV